MSQTTTARTNPTRPTIVKRVKTFIRMAMLNAASFGCHIFKVSDCYTCPICGNYGRFLTERPESGAIRKAICPKCGSLSRHRLQYLVFKEIIKPMNTCGMSMLHFAPDKSLMALFRSSFQIYLTADLYSPGVDRKEDLTKMSFADGSFDFFYASHVLEHVKDDLQALSEIRRVLKNGGVAVIPVPVIGEKTVEYAEPNPHEHDHVRCPGMDYYERYRDYFAVVRIFRSSDFDEKYQVFVYEDRTKWPDTMPLRPIVPGKRHEDVIAVCYR